MNKYMRVKYMLRETLRTMLGGVKKSPKWLWIVLAVAAALAVAMYFRREGFEEASDKKYPHWGWGKNAGLRCTNNDNTGCNTRWENGKLVDINPTIDCKAPKGWKNDQCLCLDPRKQDSASGWCTACVAPWEKKADGSCGCPGNTVWRNDQCLPPLLDCKAPKQWKNDQCVCIDPTKSDGPGGWCTVSAPAPPAAAPGALPDFTWDQRVRQCEGLGDLMPFGRGKAYVCKTNPNVKADYGKGKEYAWDVEWQCCKNTNYDCNNKGFKGVWQAASQAGLKGSGYWDSNDGCNIDVFGLDGQPIAVNKISGLWKANPLVAFGQGNILGGIGALPFVPPQLGAAARAGEGVVGAK
jgi:hypothetical protein